MRYRYATQAAPESGAVNGRDDARTVPLITASPSPAGASPE